MTKMLELVISDGNLVETQVDKKIHIEIMDFGTKTIFVWLGSLSAS